MSTITNLVSREVESQIIPYSHQSASGKEMYFEMIPKLVTNWFLNDLPKRGFALHSAVRMTSNKPLVWWITQPPVMVIMKTNFHLKLFVSLVKQWMRKLYLPSQPKFVMTVFLGASAIAVIEKDVVLSTRPRKRYTTLELVLLHL